MTRPTKQPWDPDDELSAPRAASLIALADSRFREASLQRLSGGWDFHTFLVDESWIFRFPKRAEISDALLREWMVIDELRRMRLRYEVPNHVIRVRPTTAYPRPFSGYPLCAGTPSIECDIAPRRDNLEGFLSFLERLQVINMDLEAENPWDVEQWRRDTLNRRLPKLTPLLGDALSSAATRLLSMRVQPATESVFLHNDLGPDHLLVAADGAVTAVIDWADATYGDPAADMVGAVMCWGFGDVRQLVPRDDGFWDRVRVRATLAAVSMIWFGEDASRPAYTRSGMTILQSVV